MAVSFFEEFNRLEVTGVAYKTMDQKKFILNHFSNHGNSTIGDLCKAMSLSAPKVAALLGDLLQDGLIQDHGKMDSGGGRKPNLYGLIAQSAFFMGVDVKNSYVMIGLCDIQKNIVQLSEKLPFELENDKISLQFLCELIETFIQGLTVSKEKILGICVNISGRVNHATGFSYSYYYFDEQPLAQILESRLGIQVLLENDSKAMAFGEFYAGVRQGEKNVLFINIDYGLGLGILVNNELYYGKSGFSGEFGHIPLFNNEIICRCGKKGCLETEGSGLALVRLFKEYIGKGYTSAILSQYSLDEIRLEHLIEGIQRDDTLCIELLAIIGENIGRGIALLMNIFNPELVIIGGDLAETKEYLRLPIQSAINKYALHLVYNDTPLKMSLLGQKAGIIGACFLARNTLMSFTDS